MRHVRTVLLLLAACNEVPPLPASPALIMVIDEEVEAEDALQIYYGQRFEVEAGKPVTLHLRAIDLETKKPLAGLTATHGRVLHTFIVSEDLTEFHHLHHEDTRALTAEDLEQATFRIPFVFSRGGRYHVITQGVHQCLHHVENYWTIDVKGGDPQGPIEVSPESTRVFGDYSVTLTPSATKVRAGIATLLTYEITSGGAPVRDLELYLGEEMHVFAIREDALAWGHYHPEPPGFPLSEVHGCLSARTEVEFPGPDVPVRVRIPSIGWFKVFGTFQRGGVSTKVDFWMKVVP